MYLIYLDESGNSGTNLHESQQPVFVLCALVVPEGKWLPIEIELQASIDRFFPHPRPEDFEVHANELINPRGFFRTIPIKHRLEFLENWMQIAARNELKVIYRAIVKKRYARWLQTAFGGGVVIRTLNTTSRKPFASCAAIPVTCGCRRSSRRGSSSSPTRAFFSNSAMYALSVRGAWRSKRQASR